MRTVQISTKGTRKASRHHLEQPFDQPVSGGRRQQLLAQQRLWEGGGPGAGQPLRLVPPQRALQHERQEAPPSQALAQPW